MGQTNRQTYKVLQQPNVTTTLKHCTPDHPATNSQQQSQKQDSMHSIISSSKSWREIEHCHNWEFCYAIFMNLLLLGVSGVSLFQLKWVSLDQAILKSLRKVTLGRMNSILGLRTALGDVRCSWQWFPKPWKSTWPTVVCFSFPGKKPKPECCHVLRINLQSKPFLPGSIAVWHSSASSVFALLQCTPSESSINAWEFWIWFVFCCEETWRKKKLNVLLIVPLDFQCDERAQETGFFSQIETLILFFLVFFVFVVSGFLWVK